MYVHYVVCRNRYYQISFPKPVPKYSAECKEYEELNTSQNTTDRAQHSAQSIDGQMRTLASCCQKIKNPTPLMHSALE